VDFVTSPIHKVTPNGIETIDGEHQDLDVLVCATGGICVTSTALSNMFHLRIWRFFPSWFWHCGKRRRYTQRTPYPGTKNIPFYRGWWIPKLVSILWTELWSCFRESPISRGASGGLRGGGNFKITTRTFKEHWNKERGGGRLWGIPHCTFFLFITFRQWPMVLIVSSTELFSYGRYLTRHFKLML